MKIKLAALIAVLFVAGLALWQWPRRPPPEPREPDSVIEQLAARGRRIALDVGESVVRIEQPASSDGRTSQAQGSGIVVTEDGHILTNKHVVGDADDVRVSMAEQVFDGEVLGSDTLTDLALVKIQAKDFSPVVWGDSDQLARGDLVWSLGCPFGIEQSLSFGIVSATPAAVASSANDFHGFLQTDAVVHPGSSGGPVINAEAQVVGVNTANVGGGASFAVPSNTARKVLSELIARGYVRRGWMGATLADAGTASGVIVTGVARDSPAELAKLLVGDIIEQWNHQDVNNALQLGKQIAASRIGSEVSLRISRAGTQIEISVRVAERPTLGGHRITPEK